SLNHRDTESTEKTRNKRKEEASLPGPGALSVYCLFTLSFLLCALCVSVVQTLLVPHSNPFDPQRVFPQELLALRLAEDARGRAHGADAARSQGAGQPQATLSVQVMEQAAEEARIESIAAAAAVHEVDRKNAGLEANPLGHQDGAVAAHRDHD